MRSAIQYENRVSTFLSRGFNIRNMGLDMGQVFKTLKIRMSYHFVASWHWLSYSCRGTSYPHLKYQVWSNSFDVFRGEFPVWEPQLDARNWEILPDGTIPKWVSRILSHTAISMCWISWHCRCSMDFPIQKTCSMDLFIKTFVFGGFFYLHRSQKTHEFPHRWAQGASP